MKCTLIVDSLGPNPNYKPPQRNDYETAEAHADAEALYDEPAEIIVPAGTVLSDPFAWVHCFPDASGVILTQQRDPRDRKIKYLPRRAGPGTVRAVPADEACEAALRKHIEIAAKARGVRVEYIRKEVEQQVKASRDEQARIDAEKPLVIEVAAESPAA